MYGIILHTKSLLFALKLKVITKLASINNRKQTEIHNIYSLKKRDLKIPIFRASIIECLLKIFKKHTPNLTRLACKNIYFENTTLRNKINLKGCKK